MSLPRLPVSLPLHPPSWAKIAGVILARVMAAGSDEGDGRLRELDRMVSASGVRQETETPNSSRRLP